MSSFWHQQKRSNSSSGLVAGYIHYYFWLCQRPLAVTSHIFPRTMTLVAPPGGAVFIFSFCRWLRCARMHRAVLNCSVLRLAVLSHAEQRRLTPVTCHMPVHVVSGGRAGPTLLSAVCYTPIVSQSVSQLKHLLCFASFQICSCRLMKCSVCTI